MSTWSIKLAICIMECIRINKATAVLILGALCLYPSFGCSQRIADFTGISTKNIYVKGIDISSLPKKQGVEGEDVRFLGINANIKDALDAALEKGNGNLMIDCAVYIWSAPFVSGYKVRGTVVDVPYRREFVSASHPES